LYRIVPDTGTVVALIGAFGLGSVIGVALRAEHERAERRRDRMIAVAEEFLRAIEAADDAIRTVVNQFEHARPSTEGEREQAVQTVNETLVAARLKIREAEAIIPRLDLIFPGRAFASAPHEYAFPVVGSGGKLLETVSTALLATLTQEDEPAQETGVAPADVVDDEPDEVDKEPEGVRAAFDYAHGRFAGYANSVIWARWYTNAWRRIV
jgi:hypothetical protein